MPLSSGEGRGEGLSLLAPSPGVAPSLATDNLRSHTSDADTQRPPK